MNFDLAKGVAAWPPGNSFVPGETNYVDIWRISIADMAEEAAEYELYFAHDEIQRASRYHFPRDRERYIAGRWALRTILSQYLGIGRRDLNFIYSEKGKPGVYQSGEIPTVNFNLSHSHDLALLGIAFGRRIGIDIEWMRPVNFMQIARTIFSSTELAAFERVPIADQVVAFYNAWTRKEAYLKAKGDGITATLQDFSVVLTPGEEPRLIEDLEDLAAPQNWGLYEINVAKDYRAAVAVEAEPPAFRFYDFSSIA